MLNVRSHQIMAPARDGRRPDGHKTLVVIVLALYTLSTLSILVFSSAVYLYGADLVDSTITASEVLMVISVSHSLETL